MGDIGLHVAVDMVEPLRITGNIVGIVATLIILLGIARSYALYILGFTGIAIVAVNTLFSSENGFAILMLVFIGVSLFLLLRWAQIKSAEANSEGENASGRFYHRWWVALPASLFGVAIVLLTGLSVTLGNSH